VERASEIDWSAFSGIRRLGVTAGASAPEILVEDIIAAFGERYDVTVEAVSTANENITFKLPRPLRDMPAA
jgi:4-hydroxy-3-methylbut-2-enyl diphosphate reductase